MKIFSLLKTEKLMLVKSIITEKCFANQVRRDSVHSIVSVMHWIWQASLTEGSQCVYICKYIYVYICVCVDSWCSLKAFVWWTMTLIVKSRFASWQTPICQRPSLLSTLPGMFVHSHSHTHTHTRMYLVHWFLKNPIDISISVLKTFASQPLIMSCVHSCRLKKKKK